MEEVRDAAVNDKKFLRSDISKCHRAEVSLDGAVWNIKASWWRGQLSSNSSLTSTLVITP